MHAILDVHMILHAAEHALLDCVHLVPFLLLTVFLMEYLEHRAGDRLVSTVRRAGRFGPALGAALGCIPQCGFSAACAHLFNGGLVSAGTLVAIFLSTSDEALPILLSHTDRIDAITPLLLIKIAVALIAGFLLDVIWSRSRQQAAYAANAQEHDCECTEESAIGRIVLEAIKRTLSILLFLVLFSFILGILIEAIGEEQLAACLLPGPFQPLLAGLVGFIPNCASSVLLTQLYLDGMISFGSAVAGLCTASGVGLLVLLRGKRRAKEYAVVLGSIYAAAVIAGLLLQLI